MNLYDLMCEKREEIDPQHVLVLRHRPWEPQLNKVLPWLAAERPDLFNAFQETQDDPRVEQAMTQARSIAAFIGHEPGKGLFVGVYSVKKPPRLITRKQFWQVPANLELREFGMSGFTEESRRSSISWFDLELMTDVYAEWKGKLIVRWPRPDRAWYRWMHKPKNEMPILAILEDSALDNASSDWKAIDLTWEELRVLPTRLKAAMEQWRGIYYIFDTLDGKGYVGAAYGSKNLLGRWLGCTGRGDGGYAARGHGGNRLLQKRDPKTFRFTILQLVEPDMDKDDVIRIESTWKDRLHTRHPSGLNDN
jgi:hypothetical protein